MRQNQVETRGQNGAMKSMSKEAKQLTNLLAGYRRELHELARQRAKAALSNVDMGILDERRNNLLLTLAVLEDRLSAVQGLIDLGRPHRIRVH